MGRNPAMNPQHLTAPEKVAQAIVAYYRLTEKLSMLPQAVAEWLDMLPPSEKQALAMLNFPQLSRLPAFKRYYLEKHGYSIDAYMADHLTPSELSYWADDNGHVL
jgi:hypothetical protein